MPLFMISYDVRVTNHNYTNLYACLNQWGAGHLQNSVWLAQLKGPASAVRDIIRQHVHPNDTVAVVQLSDFPDWAIHDVRPEGAAWLKRHRA